ncbi:uncharacterized protein C1orf226 [Hippocampus zosterae]|uniref:uncharacterized protein C1orf226 n=1 Tax=Hippocampus zosterae TaxID=109293 RepID=UPI00223DB0C7|nr:uncharacterized protein C1orf226 [Hippocampus zosterae]
MFENSVAQQRSPQTSRQGQPSAKRTPVSPNANLGAGSSDSPSSGGQQRLKNAINLGKAKMNDLLRRKESSHAGDIGVTEVNKNAAAVWTRMDQLGQNLANSHFPFDDIPRLDPPPPSGKKRLPRALMTTREMMISSDPVVSSPDAADLPSPISSPETTPFIAEEDAQNGEPDDGSADFGSAAEPAGGISAVGGTEVAGSDGKAETRAEESSGGHVEEQQLHPSVPDLLNKDPPLLEARAKTCEVWQGPLDVDSGVTSSPRSGKTRRLSLCEEASVAESGKDDPPTPEDAEPHPDLLSFD